MTKGRKGMLERTRAIGRGGAVSSSSRNPMPCVSAKKGRKELLIDPQPRNFGIRSWRAETGYSVEFPDKRATKGENQPSGNAGRKGA